MTTRRWPLLGLAAGLALPGLGQIYCGQIARGLAILLAIAELPWLTAWLALHGPAGALAPVVLLGTAGGVALYAWSVRDAYRTARRGALAEGPWQSPLVYALCIAAGYLLLFGPLLESTRANLLETFHAPSGSMQPSIAPGDLFLADKRVNRPGGIPLARGDVALFIYPNQRVNTYVKRIIGLPGDRIEIDGTTVRVNGRSIRGRALDDLGSPVENRLLANHVAFEETGDRGKYPVLWPKRFSAEPPVSFEVPNAHVFVLGDNRGASQDSRKFGTIPVADVRAVARQVLFSRAPGAGLHAGRIGKLIR